MLNLFEDYQYLIPLGRDVRHCCLDKIVYNKLTVTSLMPIIDETVVIGHTRTSSFSLVPSKSFNMFNLSKDHLGH